LVTFCKLLCGFLKRRKGGHRRFSIGRDNSSAYELLGVPLPPPPPLLVLSLQTPLSMLLLLVPKRPSGCVLCDASCTTELIKQLTLLALLLDCCTPTVTTGAPLVIDLPASMCATAAFSRSGTPRLEAASSGIPATSAAVEYQLSCSAFTTSAGYGLPRCSHAA
jgi:hypothetical protein